MAVGHQVIVKYTYLDMCNGWVGGYVVGMGEWLHELFEVFFKFSASHPISNILYPHDWIYIYYIIIYIYCNIFTHVSILRNLMLYTLYIICTIYIYMYCMSWMYHLYHIHKKTFAVLFDRSVKNLATQLADRRVQKTPRRTVTVRGSNMGFNHEQ